MLLGEAITNKMLVFFTLKLDTQTGCLPTRLFQLEKYKPKETEVLLNYFLEVLLRMFSQGGYTSAISITIAIVSKYWQPNTLHTDI